MSRSEFMCVFCGESVSYNREHPCGVYGGQMVTFSEAIMEQGHADPIDHPGHYTFGSIEIIDAIEAWGLGFHLGNVVKYVARARHKGEELSDLKKARWYLDREIQRKAAQ